ncbi:hypothetical protein J6590_068092 [Homalodisca vitripennis]|nr:hypothetical protein J6590_068092 [Homalodisca vitripennis]
MFKETSALYLEGARYNQVERNQSDRGGQSWDLQGIFYDYVGAHSHIRCSRRPSHPMFKETSALYLEGARYNQVERNQSDLGGQSRDLQGIFQEAPREYCESSALQALREECYLGSSRAILESSLKSAYSPAVCYDNARNIHQIATGSPQVSRRLLSNHSHDRRPETSYYRAWTSLWMQPFYSPRTAPSNTCKWLHLHNPALCNRSSDLKVTALQLTAAENLFVRRSSIGYT